MPHAISETKTKYVLAPMAGYTDVSFRRLCASFGADYVVSEMISAATITMGDRKTASLAAISENEAPVILQIFGHDPDMMAKAADILLSGNYPGCSYAAPPAGIDINMGCPVKKIVTSGDGSALMKNIPLAEKIIYSVKNVCASHGVPLSVKFRLGWDDASVNAEEFACAAAKNGADRITLHTRTREQMYAPSAKPEYAGKVIDALRSRGFSTPLTGNGDIDSPASAKIYLDAGCDEAAIGRAALGNPWLFAQLKDPDGFNPPTHSEIISLILSFVCDVVAEKGELNGIRESRGRAAHFLKGIRGAAKIRDQLNHADTFEQFEKILTTAEEIK